MIRIFLAHGRTGPPEVVQEVPADLKVKQKTKKTKKEQKHIIILHRAGWESSLTRPVSQDLVPMVAVVLGRCTLFLRETIFPLLIYSNFKSNYLIVNHPLVLSSKLQRHLLGDSDDHIQHKVLKTIFKIGYFIHDIQHCFAPRDLKPESIPQ